MHTRESCMFLDIVLELSVQEYSRNPKNKVKNNDTPHTHIHIYINTFIYEKLSTHIYMKQSWKIIYFIFPIKSHDINFF